MTEKSYWFNTENTIWWYSWKKSLLPYSLWDYSLWAYYCDPYRVYSRSKRVFTHMGLLHIKSYPQALWSWRWHFICRDRCVRRGRVSVYGIRRREVAGANRWVPSFSQRSWLMRCCLSLIMSLVFSSSLHRRGRSIIQPAPHCSCIEGIQRSAKKYANLAKQDPGGARQKSKAIAGKISRNRLPSF